MQNLLAVLISGNKTIVFVILFKMIDEGKLFIVPYKISNYAPGFSTMRYESVSHSGNSWTNLLVLNTAPQARRTVILKNKSIYSII